MKEIAGITLILDICIFIVTLLGTFFKDDSFNFKILFSKYKTNTWIFILISIFILLISNFHIYSALFYAECLIAAFILICIAILIGSKFDAYFSNRKLNVFTKIVKFCIYLLLILIIVFAMLIVLEFLFLSILLLCSMGGAEIF